MNNTQQIKEYKRFTRYNENTHYAEVYAYSIDKDVYFDGVEIVGNENANLAQETINRLAELEDDLESGKIVRLPCKVGDTAYVLDRKNRIVELEIVEYSLSVKCKRFYAVSSVEGYGYWLYESELNYDWFLTKAEAEKNLKNF